MHLRSDPWLAEFIAQELPSQDVARKFLNAFHEDGKIEEAQQRRLPDEIAYIPEENRALAGLGRVNRDLIHCLRGRCADQKIATVDPDATIIECGKPETDVDCEDRVELDYKFFYTCNLSSKTEFPRKNGAFDGDFKVAACEDIELGYRLTKAGMRFLHNRKPLAYHWQYLSFDDACRRARKAALATKFSTNVAYVFSGCTASPK